MTDDQKQKKIQEILRKYQAKMLQIEKAKLKIITEIKNIQAQTDLDKIRKKLHNL